jgi:hypothetical protein
MDVLTLIMKICAASSLSLFAQLVRRVVCRVESQITFSGWDDTLSA